MKLGKYDQRIQFITEGAVSDGAGGTIPSTIDLLNTWARIEQLKASRDIAQAQMNLPAIYRVGVQARKGFAPQENSLIRWQNKVYMIISSPVVDDVRLNKEWIFDIRKKD